MNSDSNSNKSTGLKTEFNRISNLINNQIKGGDANIKWYVENFVKHEDIYFMNKKEIMISKILEENKGFIETWLGAEESAKVDGKNSSGEKLQKKLNYVEIYYKKSDKLLYKGIVTSLLKMHGKNVKYFYQNGRVAFEGDIYEGKKEGHGKLYYKNGTVMFDGFFKTDQQNCQ